MGENSPLVSVVIPTYNRAKKLLRAISSVLYQTYRNFEVIVVDDGSEDNTRELVAKYFNGRVIYIQEERNKGVSAARNRGIGVSRGSMVAFLDSDDYWLPGKLKEQVEFFVRHKDAVICQTDEIWIRNGIRVNPKKKHLKPDGDIFKPSLRLCLVSPSAVVIKRELFDEVGLFDETLPACEDYDLWLRISCSYPVFLIRKKLVVKEGGHGDQLSARYRSMDLFRIRSIVKLLRTVDLDPRKMAFAMEELARKCHIYAHGCIKRGRMEEGNFYYNLPQNLEKELFKDGRPVGVQA